MLFDSSSAVGAGRWPCADDTTDTWATDAGRARSTASSRSASPVRVKLRRGPGGDAISSPTSTDGGGASRSGWGGGKTSMSPTRCEDFAAIWGVIRKKHENVVSAPSQSISAHSCSCFVGASFMLLCPCVSSPAMGDAPSRPQPFVRFLSRRPCTCRTQTTRPDRTPQLDRHGYKPIHVNRYGW